MKETHDFDDIIEKMFGSRPVKVLTTTKRDTGGEPTADESGFDLGNVGTLIVGFPHGSVVVFSTSEWSSVFLGSQDDLNVFTCNRDRSGRFKMAQKVSA